MGHVDDASIRRRGQAPRVRSHLYGTLRPQGGGIEQVDGVPGPCRHDKGASVGRDEHPAWLPVGFDLGQAFAGTCIQHDHPVVAGNCDEQAAARRIEVQRGRVPPDCNLPQHTLTIDCHGGHRAGVRIGDVDEGTVGRGDDG
ncbi:MAG: hypothetical protein MAG471_01564 [Acidimicrobiaceae bacterium]|nr:hypothetical protein [Acidimicrobiaceae bacterium]